MKVETAVQFLAHLVWQVFHSETCIIVDKPLMFALYERTLGLEITSNAKDYTFVVRNISFIRIFI